MKNKSLYTTPNTRIYELTLQRPLAGSTDVKLSDNTEHNFNADNNESDWLTNKKEGSKNPIWD